MQISDDLKQRCEQQMHRHQLPTSFWPVIEQIYLPLAQRLLSHKHDRPLLVTINGAQGTGKSTLTDFLKMLLEFHSGQPAAAFSIDDFYLTRDQRLRLAQQEHPLLITRGVPGTHEIELLEQTIDGLTRQQPVAIPVFDKAIDDRLAQSRWTTIDRPVDFILFEGWCNLSPVQQADELLQPINRLETEEDPDGHWRRFANAQLAVYHERLFERTDISIMLRAPAFEKVYDWRRLQEDKLRRAKTGSNARQVMDESSLQRFIQHYERITRHTLAHLPEQVDFLLPIDDTHQITGIESTWATS